jgi:hypothetical protein
MEALYALYARCAGLDGRQKTGVACRVFPPESGRKQQEARPLDATPRARLTWLDWLDWLREGGGTHGAWESTGEYGKPGSNLLEGRAALLRQGLVQGSFVPGRPPREWRDLTRVAAP